MLLCATVLSCISGFFVYVGKRFCEQAKMGVGWTCGERQVHDVLKSV